MTPSAPASVPVSENELAIPLPRPTAPAPRVSSQKSLRIEELDGLRGIAALFAVMYHYAWGPSVAWLPVAAFRSVLEYAPLGLDTFFILSGFLIGGILLRSKYSSNYYKPFYVRRFYRILPLYYAWVAVFAALLCVTRGWGLTMPAGYSAPVVIASFLLMVHNWSPALIDGSYMMGPSWSLAVEEHFYLVAPLCVRRLNRRRLVQLLLGVVAGAPLLRALVFKFVGHGSAWSDTAVYIWTPCHADALALGVLLAIAWASESKRDWLRRHSRLLPLGMAGFAALGLFLSFLNSAQVPHTFALNRGLGRTIIEMSCLCLMVFVLTRPQSFFCGLLRTRFLSETGKISYCLYVIHWGVLWMITRFVLHTRFGERPVLDAVVALVSLAVSYGVASLSWKFFEYPLVRMSRRQDVVSTSTTVRVSLPELSPVAQLSPTEANQS
ncbi:MAG TPA: acyltransferase [Candidatus Acidoferrales bacterium]|nr:acyltransferase [Candidatus Acidoferrales bacterium]